MPFKLCNSASLSLFVGQIVVCGLQFGLSQHGALVPREVGRHMSTVAATGVPSGRAQAPSLEIVKEYVPTTWGQ